MVLLPGPDFATVTQAKYSSLKPTDSPEDFRARHPSTQMCMCPFFLQKTHDEQILPWDVILILLFFCCSQSALGISLPTGGKQCNFHKQCQIFACTAKDISPSQIKGNTIRTDAIGNHNPYSQQYKVSEAGGAQFLFLT